MPVVLCTFDALTGVASAADYSKGTVDGRLAAEPISLDKDLSVCDSALRMKSSASASGKLGARAAITGRRAYDLALAQPDRTYLCTLRWTQY